MLISRRTGLRHPVNSVTDALALLLFFTGLGLLCYCIVLFIVHGKGTLSPADPTRQLVVTGVYSYTRNPMYLAVTLMLAGEALYFSSGVLLVYAVAVFIAFNLFIVLHEEPRLRRDFGDQYTAYTDKVRRWL